ncbi:MAG: lytic transglycosylase domain-containing protein [Desulfobacterales bacterium]|nr:lytic transglycosylase domain-containing protein [Desulfobacterales bacterium]
MPETAKAIGILDPFDPKANIFGGTRLLRSHIDEFGSLKRSLIAYNAGPHVVSKELKVPKETRKYVKKVIQYYRMYKKFLLSPYRCRSDQLGNVQRRLSVNVLISFCVQQIIEWNGNKLVMSMYYKRTCITQIKCPAFQLGNPKLNSLHINVNQTALCQFWPYQLSTIYGQEEKV